ncbi:hypothetical protein GOODEAATRI_024446 [Goodea atripinnis]|uniref:Uncharacterized protein n=1 Tax=Goodea atripinnis TaxID=208336 RepID=A0ABV0MUY9_9TELE
MRCEPAWVLSTSCIYKAKSDKPKTLFLIWIGLMLDVTVRGLSANSCECSSRWMLWQPGPTHPTRHSHSVKHPFSNKLEGNLVIFAEPLTAVGKHHPEGWKPSTSDTIKITALVLCNNYRFVLTAVRVKQK